MRTIPRRAATTLTLVTLLTWTAPLAATPATAPADTMAIGLSLDLPARALDRLAATLHRLLAEARRRIAPEATATAAEATTTGPGAAKFGCEIDPYGDD